ncbi:MAG: FKBP-type peptidyl-prolyl cis-trans isomerase [Candidatus Jordarchaeum sp.]|uniref:FKBP-type peptidyl-prolyl cis-trans isomerase n=1 Tax=Candidatus Jordarchaeum sp. TaxID=2823881 RepID=UPI00404B5B3B
MPAKKGDKVKIEYIGTLNDGTVFDTSEGKKPLEFEVGSGRIIKGLEQAVIGMEIGEEIEIKIEPKDAYGYGNPDLIKKIPREKLPENLEPGMILKITTHDGEIIRGEVAKVTDQEVTLDLNHPLAGLVLNFKIKLIDIS